MKCRLFLSLFCLLGVIGESGAQDPGTVIWKKVFDWSIRSTAMDSHDRLCVLTDSDSLFVLSPDGEISWSRALPARGYRLIVGYHDNIYVSLEDEGLAKYSQQGQLLLHHTGVGTGFSWQLMVDWQGNVLLGDSSLIIDPAGQVQGTLNHSGSEWHLELSDGSLIGMQTKSVGSGRMYKGMKWVNRDGSAIYFDHENQYDSAQRMGRNILLYKGDLFSDRFDIVCLSPRGETLWQKRLDGWRQFIVLSDTTAIVAGQFINHHGEINESRTQCYPPFQSMTTLKMADDDILYGLDLSWNKAASDTLNAFTPDGIIYQWCVTDTSINRFYLRSDGKVLLVDRADAITLVETFSKAATNPYLRQGQTGNRSLSNGTCVTVSIDQDSLHVETNEWVELNGNIDTHGIPQADHQWVVLSKPGDAEIAWRSGNTLMPQVCMNRPGTYVIGLEGLVADEAKSFDKVVINLGYEEKHLLGMKNITDLTVSSTGTLYAIRNDTLCAIMKDGRMRFHLLPAHGYFQLMPGAGDRLYILRHQGGWSIEGQLMACDTLGQVLWEYNVLGEANGGMALAEDNAVVVTNDYGQIIKIDQSGKLIWANRASTDVLRAPSISPDGSVYCLSYPKYYVFKGSGNQPLDYAGDIYNDSFYLDVFSAEGTFKFSLDLGGNVNVKLWGTGLEAPMSVSGMLFCYNSGRVTAIAPSGEIAWMYDCRLAIRQLAITSQNRVAVLCDGTLFYLNEDGTLHHQIYLPWMTVRFMSANASGGVLLVGGHLIMNYDGAGNLLYSGMHSEDCVCKVLAADDGRLFYALGESGVYELLQGETPSVNLSVWPNIGGRADNTHSNYDSTAPCVRINRTFVDEPRSGKVSLTASLSGQDVVRSQWRCVSWPVDWRPIDPPEGRLNAQFELPAVGGYDFVFEAADHRNRVSADRVSIFSHQKSSVNLNADTSEQEQESVYCYLGMDLAGHTYWSTYGNGKKLYEMKEDLTVSLIDNPDQLSGWDEWHFDRSGTALQGVVAVGIDSTVYLSSWGSAVRAMRHGMLLWEYPAGCRSLAAGPGNLIYGCRDSLYCWNSTGTLLASAGGSRMSVVAVSDQGNVLVIGQEDLMLFTSDLQLLWSYSLNNDYITDSVISGDEQIYFCDGAGSVSALDAEGNLLWETDLSGRSAFLIIGEDSRLYYGSNKEIACLGRDGSIIWRYAAPGVSTRCVLRDDGLLCFGANDGLIHVLKVSDSGIAKGGWPVRGHDYQHTYCSTGSGSSAAAGGHQPLVTGLKQNYPNPFNASTAIEYDLAGPAEVSVTVFNSLGQKIGTLARGSQAAGRHKVVWDAGKNPSGLYFIRMKAGDKILIKKCLLIR